LIKIKRLKSANLPTFLIIIILKKIEKNKTLKNLNINTMARAKLFLLLKFALQIYHFCKFCFIMVAVQL